MLNENVKKLLKAGMWDLATCAGEMIERIKERYKKYLYIEGMPEEKANVPFLRQARLPGDGKRRGDSNLQLQR